MPVLVKRVAVCLGVVLASVAQPAWAQDTGWLGPKGDVSASSSGDTAQIYASTQTVSTGNTQPQPPPVPGYAPAPEAAQFDPWAKYTVVMKPGSTTLQMCATFNAGLAGTAGVPVEVCYDVAVPQDAPAAGVVVDPAVLAASAVARLSVPQPAITLSPQPSDNQWGALAVGLPIWAWASDQGPVATAVTEQGIDIQMTATRGSVRFDWGDGTSTVCTVMRPRPEAMNPLTPSPDCGHTYLLRDDYTITATAGWAVSWQALGQSGTLPLTSSSTVSVPIREFLSVVVG